MAVNKQLPLETVLSRVMPGQTVHVYIYDAPEHISDETEFYWPHYDAEWMRKYKKGDVWGMFTRGDYALVIKADAPEGGKK